MPFFCHGPLMCDSVAVPHCGEQKDQKMLTCSALIADRWNLLDHTVFNVMICSWHITSARHEKLIRAQPTPSFFLFYFILKDIYIYKNCILLIVFLFRFFHNLHKACFYLFIDFYVFVIRDNNFLRNKFPSSVPSATHWFCSNSRFTHLLLSADCLVQTIILKRFQQHSF